MKRRSLLVFLFLLFLPALANAAAKNVHVYVALCDNIYQRIVPVPWSLGQGNKPETNLYWGAMYGLKTFFKGKKEWELVQTVKEPEAYILERLVFRHKATGRFLVADAYQGKRIKNCLSDFLAAGAGHNPKTIRLEKESVEAGGAAGLVLYVGHNGLMEFSLKTPSSAKNQSARDVVVFACQSKAYFREMLLEMGAKPLLLTTGNMAPEAYIVHALADSWLLGKKPSEIREAVAKAYEQYQKCGMKAARNLFSMEKG